MGPQPCGCSGGRQCTAHRQYSAFVEEVGCRGTRRVPKSKKAQNVGGAALDPREGGLAHGLVASVRGGRLSVTVAATVCERRGLQQSSQHALMADGRVNVLMTSGTLTGTLASASSATEAARATAEAMPGLVEARAMAGATARGGAAEAADWTLETEGVRGQSRVHLDAPPKRIRGERRTHGFAGFSRSASRVESRRSKT